MTSSHGFTSEEIRIAAKKVLIEQPKFLKLGDKDAASDVNGRTFDFEILCELPGIVGARWKKVRCFMAMECPGLLDASPSPDNNLRRGREVQEEMREKEQVRPTLN